MPTFKQPPKPYVIRRDGTVTDRATGRTLGRVVRDLSGGGWTHDRSRLAYYAWPTRDDAARALHHESGGS